MKDKAYIQLLSDLEPDNWNVYPRPQLKREGWMNLNGIWKIKNPAVDRSIRVPFAPQAELSAYDTPSASEVPEELLYERNFRIPKSFFRHADDRILLHFGAVDQIADVFVNGRPVMHHEGGYLPFSCDITDVLRPEGEDNLLNVFCIDRLDHKYPWGKQKKKRGGMWYTPVSGIWQTVWIEAVPSLSVEAVRVRMIGDEQQVDVDLTLRKYDPLQGKSVLIPADCDFSYRIRTPDGELTGKGKESHHAIMLPAWRLWSPEDPWLYRMEICCGQDRVETYFALRRVSSELVNGHPAICLNGKPIFIKGVLDQGYFCDGLFLPANPTGYEKDILRMKELGFNLLRKHIKIEPEQFYYDCDRLGMLVMQDMVNNGSYSFLFDTALPTIGLSDLRPDLGRILPAERERREIFLAHARETIGLLYGHPSVIAYTIFNEGWGQFDSDHVSDLLKKEDPTRLYDDTSGWFAGRNSQFESIHNYFRPGVIKSRKHKSGDATEKLLFLSECGGCTRMIPDHSYSLSRNYGYGKAEDETALMEQIEKLYKTMIYPSIAEGLCGFIYTQLSDIEDEVNGFYTYDRKICKVDKKRMQKLNEAAKF